jgi:hypothetical protein
MRRPRTGSKASKELADLEEKSDALTQTWRAEKEKLNGAQKLKEELDQAGSSLSGPAPVVTWPRRVSWPMAPFRNWKKLKETEAAKCKRRPIR